MPKVSVVIPTHNRSALLHLAIQSVLQQTFQDFEIVIVDDASNDDTREVISQFNDRRIKYIGREISGGPSAARNEGILNSHCEYIAFLDDDDEWLREKLQRQIQILENSPLEIGGVYTGTVDVDRVSERIISTRLGGKRGDLFDDLLCGYNIITSSLMFRKLCFEKVGMFDETICFGEDLDMWLRIAKEFQFECIEEPLTKYYHHTKKLTTNFDLVIKGKEALLEKYEQWNKLNPKVYSKKFLELGIVHCLNGNSEKGRIAYRRSIALDPYKIKPYLIFFLSCMGTNVFRKVTELWDKLSVTCSL